MSFGLVCHENIPGSGYTRGDLVTDSQAIADIKANAALSKHFTQATHPVDASSGVQQPPPSNKAPTAVISDKS